MYIISVDNQDWLVGDSKGWLSTTPLRSMAAVYATLLEAQETLVYYASNYSNVTFTIHPLKDSDQTENYPIFESPSNGIINNSSNAFIQRN